MITFGRLLKRYVDILEESLKFYFDNGNYTNFYRLSYPLKFFSRRISKLRILVHRTNKIKYVRSHLQKRYPRKVMVVSVSVWGARYMNLFFNIFLPSFLDIETIADLNKRYQIILVVHTSETDMAEVARRIAYLGDNFVSVEIEPIDDRLFKSPEVDIKYELYALNHTLDLQFAQQLNAVYVPIAPDGLHSHRSLLNYINKIESGKSVVLISALRAQAEYVIPHLADQLSTFSLKIKPELVVKFGLENIHHSFYRYFLYPENNKAPDYLPLLLEPVENGVLINSKHLHPIAIDTEKLQLLPLSSQTIDAGLCFQLTRELKFDSEKIFVVQDSSIGVMIDLTYRSPELLDSIFVDRDFNQKYLNEQKFKFYRPEECWNFAQTIWYHSDEKVAHRFFRNSEAGLVPTRISS